jgi:serine/threonine protein kinase
LVTGGQLFDEIQRRKKFTERDAAVLIQQVLRATAYCHGQGLAHRDIKPENIILEEGQSYDSIKIIDFGTARMQKDDERF